MRTPSPARAGNICAGFLGLKRRGAESFFLLEPDVTGFSAVRLGSCEQQRRGFFLIRCPTEPESHMFMKLHTTLLLSAVLMAAAAPASHAADPPRNPFGNGALPEILKPYDVDGDGKLSEEERQAYLKAVREGLAERPGRPAGERPKNPFDTDGDGKLSDEEKAAAQEAIRAKIEAERTKRFDELDKDDDGFLTAEEFLGIPGLRPELASRILGHLDKDADGKISKDEFTAALRPPRPPVGGGGNGGGEPPPPPNGEHLPPPR